LAEVPKEAYYIGMAGVVPYMATSLSTVYAAWEINQAATTGSGLFLNEKSAELMLHILEPIQIGYGAAVCIRSIGSTRIALMLTHHVDHLLH
jgi:hypothetical protein